MMSLIESMIIVDMIEDMIDTIEVEEVAQEEVAEVAKSFFSKEVLLFVSL